jgi:hypothetical protein
MRRSVPSIREAAKAILKPVGLLPAAQHVATFLSASPAYRAHERRYRQLKRQHGEVLGARLSSADKQRVALVWGSSFPEVQIELGLIKGLQLANFVPVVLIMARGREGRLLAKHYKLAGVNDVLEWGAFDYEAYSATAADVVNRSGSMWDLLDMERAGVRLGRLAISSALRGTYSGSLDLQQPHERQLLVNKLAYAMASADAAQRIIQQFRPSLAMFVDTAYSPAGELFDSCIQSNVDVVQWQQGHKSNALSFKRYTRETANDHPYSLSPESWRIARDMEWTEDHSKQLDQELYGTYASGDWFSVVGTQFEKSMIDSARLRERLGLDPNKKTAIIFPHILWDAALFWGKCLFRDFEEWFVETVRTACANDGVNWVIKIHPANQRLREDGSIKEAAELVALRKNVGTLPPNIAMILPESEISTYSLFDIMDYCVTVYGTVGIEASRLGVPVLTGGTGPYDRRGFTVDSRTREEYLEKIRNIQLIPRLSPAQREMAERFAYTTFIVRPWHAKSVTLRYLPHSKEFLYEGSVNIRSKDEWYAAEDVKSFASWIGNPSKPQEFLTLLPQRCNALR